MKNQEDLLRGPLTALVQYQVRQETTTSEQWLDAWEPRAVDALSAEPETTAYEALVPHEAEDQMLVFERYTQGQASLDAHIERPAHARLITTMGEARMTKRRVMSNLYQDIPDYGWWGRPERTPVLQQAGLPMTLILTRFKSEESRQHYIRLTQEHAEYCRHSEPGTLVYSGGLAVSDSDRGPAIKAGDLLFVAVFADEQAAIKHRDDPQHQTLQPKLAEVERERILLQSYSSSGKGFLWAQRP